MLAKAISATPWGIDARLVQVEVDVHLGLPQMQIVGLPDAAVRESRERVRSAIKNCGFELAPRAVVINLAPADLKKQGNHLDLGIALALLVAHGHLEQAAVDGILACGELGLDGTIRPVRGGLAIADLARQLEVRELLLPAKSAPEAAALGGVRVVAVETLAQMIAHLVGEEILPKVPPPSGEATLGLLEVPDLADVRGQAVAKRALEVAAAGGHNLMLVGPPGSGKTMLARRLPGLLPELSVAEAIEVTKIHSLVADQPPDGLVRRRPFRAPHSGISTAGLIGGGSIPRPGEASLAHCGVLFLDEIPEFKRDTLEAMRQPLEDGEVSIVRAQARLRYPARFSLIAACNPCKCGHRGDPRFECRCSEASVEQYRGRLSGPLMDRIDLQVEVPAVTLEELRGQAGEPTKAVRSRVLRARSRQLERFGKGVPTPFNAALTPKQVRRWCSPDASGRLLLDRAFESLGLSARAHERVLKVARTIADLAGTEAVGCSHLAEAIQYRGLDRRATT